MGRETVIGIRWGNGCPCREVDVALCSHASWQLLRGLTRLYPVTYSQILFPYADALSLSDRKGTESTRIFGTHLLLRGIGEETGKALLAEGRAFLEGTGYAAQSGLSRRLAPQLTELPLTDGRVCADDVAVFLAAECGGLYAVGNFADMLSGFVPHWRIREAARMYASFTEIAFRQTGGALSGLCGGRVVLRGSGADRDALLPLLRETYFQKTGCML